MSSASKTLELLDHFSPMRPEIGLSQLCRLARRDKATTYRHLQALEETGFIEQNPATKGYRLGPALLQLAQVREITVPRKSGVEAPLQDLAKATGETTHVSVLSGKTLYKLAAHESPQHSIRVIIDIQTFPLHATASGHCALAFGPDALFGLATKDLAPFTEKTVTKTEALRRAIDTAKRTGFGLADGSLEADVCSLAAPVYDQTGLLAGAVSVASVASRYTPTLARSIRAHLVTAAREITHNWGGSVPPDVEDAWAKTLAQSQELEPTR